MYVNTKIVNALLTLRSVSLKQIADVTGISYGALQAWLNGTAKDKDERLPFERQLEVIKVLGIDYQQAHPRSDITHHWCLREPAFGDRASTYEPLRLILLCFGRCEVTYLLPERDPFLSLNARTYFGLTFEKFRAVLEITSSPIRSLAFNPHELPNMHWVGEEAPIIVKEETFITLTTPGEATPAALDHERVQAFAPVRWARLAQLAEERGVGAAELTKYLLENIPAKPALPHKRETEGPKMSPPSQTNELFFNPNGAEQPAR